MAARPRLVHLNGPPGAGKSTLARAYVDAHAGVLNCDIDVLRSLIGGWRTDFLGAGALIRPAAIALIQAYLRGGNDVVLPQLLADPRELQRFQAAAREVDADFVEVFVMAPLGVCIARFRSRGKDSGTWHAAIREAVEREGGDAVLASYHQTLRHLIAENPAAVVIENPTAETAIAYHQLCDCLSRG